MDGHSRPRRRIAVAAVLVAAVGGAIVAVVLLPGSDGPNRISEHAGIIRGKLELVRHIHLKKSHRLVDLTVAKFRQLERQVLDEQETPATPVDPTAEPVKSSNVLQAARVARADLPTTGSTVVDSGNADFTAEPDVARNGSRVLAVWNWGSAFSHDGGKTFSFHDPFEQFKKPDRFCCDQLALYDQRHDLWVWVVQWIDGEKRLRERILTAKGDAGFDAPDGFNGFDLAASTFGYPPEFGLDFPHVATTKENVFLSVNVYGAERGRIAGNYIGTVVIRFPFDKLATGRGFTYFRASSGPIALTRSASDAMYFAAHLTNAGLRVWRWRDDSNRPDHVDVSHGAFRYAPYVGYHCRRAGAPANSDWCGRSDPRPAAAWISNGVLGFAWNAQQDPLRGFPYPFVMVVQIDEDTMEVIDTSAIWSSDYAYQYPAIAPDDNGNLGGMVLAGGGSRYQTCNIVYRAANDSTWRERPVDASDDDQSEPKSGDYLGIAVDPVTNTWAGTCMTLHGGSLPTLVGIRFVSFVAP